MARREKAASQGERDREALDWQTEIEWQELYRSVREGVPPPVERFNHAMRLCHKAVLAGLGFKGVHRGLDVLALMQACNVAPNMKTYSSFVLICAAAGAQGSTVALDYGVRVVELMHEEGLAPGLKPSTRLLSALVSCDSPIVTPEESMERAVRLLVLLRDAGVALDHRPFDVLITACSRREGAMDEALRVLALMAECGVEPDAGTYSALVHACARSGHTHGADSIVQAKALVAQMEEAGLAPDVIVYSGLIQAYVRAMAAHEEDRAALLEEALAVKERMERAGVQPDGKLYAMLLHGLSRGVERELSLVTTREKKLSLPRIRRRMKASKQEAAGGGDDRIMRWYRLGHELVAEMNERGVRPTEVVYNTLLDICAKAAVRNDGRDWMLEAFAIFDQMREEGVRANIVTYNTMLDTCAHTSGRGQLGGLATASRLLEEMQREGTDPDAVSYTCFIIAARKEGTREAVEAAFGAFRALPPGKSVRNKHTYTSMIRALSSVGRWQEAVALLEDAREAGIRPDRIMYSVCMEAVGHDREAVRSLHRRMRADGIDDDQTTRKQLERVERYGTSSLRRRDTGPTVMQMSSSGHTPSLLSASSSAGRRPLWGDAGGAWVLRSRGRGGVAMSVSGQGGVGKQGGGGFGGLGGAAPQRPVGGGGAVGVGGGGLWGAHDVVQEYEESIPAHLRHLRRRLPTPVRRASEEPEEPSE